MKSADTKKQEEGDEEKREKDIYACMVCRSMFKQPGMCPDCDRVLKKKAG
ncbi:MAG: hypothetical protein HY518_02380 [Candidatus Aenigmarchaeota archaeon]|nr:hypothetical protein [Candidatus Aenigmarchaeota archaeon]